MGGFRGQAVPWLPTEDPDGPLIQNTTVRANQNLILSETMRRLEGESAMERRDRKGTERMSQLLSPAIELRPLSTPSIAGHYDISRVRRSRRNANTLNSAELNVKIEVGSGIAVTVAFTSRLSKRSTPVKPEGMVWSNES